MHCTAKDTQVVILIVHTSGNWLYTYPDTIRLFPLMFEEPSLVAVVLYM